MISGDQIQILDLRPGIKDEDPIQCDIRVESLGDQPQYEAISYVWGNQSDSLSIEVSGTRRLVTRNLHTALRQLRLKDRSRALWADQLCINQVDLDEKSKQIRWMRRIYRQTLCCIIWLGAIPEDVSVANALAVFEFLNYSAAMYNVEPSSSNDPPVPSCLASREAFEGPYKALLRMIPADNPWWHRVWTVQEVVIPRHAVLVWGNLSISWEKILRATQAIAREYLQRFRNIIWAYPSQPLNDFIAVVAWLTNMKITAYPPLQIFTIMRGRNATDPRDKVYGLLGMCPPGSLQQSEKIDYTMSVAGVYSTLTIDIILQERGLRSLVRDPRLSEDMATKDIPRWALDLKAFSKDDTDFVHLFGYNSYNANAGKELDLEKVLSTSQISSEILDLDGRFVDEIELVGDPMDQVLQGLYWENNTENLTLMRSWEALAQGHQNSKKRVLSTTTNEGPRLYNQKEAFGRLLLGDLIRTDQQQPYKRASEEDVKQVLDFLTTSKPDWPWNVSHTVGSMMQNQRFFVTKTGFMGLGHPDIEPKDEVWVFHGGKVPFVVKPRNSDIDYDFVSRCGVQGIMDGEIFEDQDEVIYHTRRVRLH